MSKNGSSTLIVTEPIANRRSKDPFALIVDRLVIVIRNS